MRKILLLFFVVAIAGGISCTYLENPETLIRDPHFAEYKQSRDDLEREYLQKKITYAEYLEQRRQLDEIYTKEVQERNSKIVPQD